MATTTRAITPRPTWGPTPWPPPPAPETDDHRSQPAAQQDRAGHSEEQGPAWGTADGDKHNGDGHAVRPDERRERAKQAGGDVAPILEEEERPHRQSKEQRLGVWLGERHARREEGAAPHSPRRGARREEPLGQPIHSKESHEKREAGGQDAGGEGPQTHSATNTKA